MRKGGGIIILEGADCSGKSTLARTIMDKVVEGGGDVLYLHGRPWVGTVRREHVRMMIQARDAAHHGAVAVLDHFWVAEQLYGVEYRNGPAYDPTMVDQVMRDLGAALVLCVPGELAAQVERHAARHKAGKEEFDKAAGIVQRYGALLTGKPTRSAFLDTGNPFVERRDVVRYDMDLPGNQGTPTNFADNVLSLARRDFAQAYGREQ